MAMAADAQPRVVVAFAQALTELVTVEKKNIVVLTEIARDALRSDPGAAPALAALISTRILQAPAAQKLPPLYLLDSISKLVGEPYKTLFAPALPEVFMCTWQAGGPGLQRPLDKLLGTWAGVYPQQVLADIQRRLAAARAPPAAPPVLQPPAAGVYPSGGGYGPAPVAPMAADPRLAMQQPVLQPPLLQQPVLQPPPMPQVDGFAAPFPQQQPPMQPQPAYAGYQQPALQPPQRGYYQQQYAATAPAEPLLPPQQQPAAPAPAQQVSVPDLLSSLVSAGLLAAPTAAPAAAPAAAPLAHTGSGSLLSTPPYAAAARATPEREQPAATSFTPERLKEHSPSALARLLRTTEATRSRFLDRKFLRRQQRAAGAAARASRFWYLDLDTWQASTTGAVPGGAVAAAGAGARAGGQAAAAAARPEECSVPVDDSQTNCALSGEPFEQFWDEAHQEWRYRGARRLGAEEAASYGLEEGALVLVSALGRPAEGVLVPAAGAGGGGGVLSELQARQEIAADLAAAAADAAGAGEAGDEAAGDAKLEAKLELLQAELLAAAEASVAAAAAAAEAGGGRGAEGAADEAQEPQEKRQRVA